MGGREGRRREEEREGEEEREEGKERVQLTAVELDLGRDKISVRREEKQERGRE